MAEPYVGEIRMFGFNFAPVGWAMCNGQIMSIQQNTALFSLIGTFYGGNGTNTFALPDLRGRVAMHQGQGVGLQQYVIGEQAGAEFVALTTQQLPSHSHLVNCDGAATARGGNVFGLGTGGSPANNFPGIATSPAHAIYSSGPANNTMNANMINPSGGGQPHENRQPFLVVTFCIALQGIFPARN
jgi:microcystin-dependent protein